MTVFIYTLKRLLKNIVMVVVIVVLPLIALIPTAISATKSAGISVGVVDNDKTSFTTKLIHRLDKNLSVTIISKKNIKNGLYSSSITYAIVIPKDFTSDIINGKSPKISGYGLKEKDCSKVVGAMIDSLVYPSKLIAKRIRGCSAAFYASIAKIPPVKAASQKKDNKMTLDLIIQFIFMASVFASTVIISDKEAKTFYRSFTAPISMRSYMLQSILCFLLLSLLQIAVLFFAAVNFLGVDPGKNPVNILILFDAAAVVSVALGVAVSSVCKSTLQATGIGLGIVIVMCMFGGAWGITPASPLALAIAKILPYYWSADAMGKLIVGKPLASVGGDLLILFGFAAVFFLAGTWRKSDIAR